MKLREGGQMAKNDVSRWHKRELAFVNQFLNLEITLTIGGQSFTKQLGERCRRTLIAMTTIRIPQRLSIKAAMELLLENDCDGGPWHRANLAGSDGNELGDAE